MYHGPCGLFVCRLPAPATPDLPGIDRDPRLPSALDIEETYA
jgi:hypothetical protein